MGKLIRRTLKELRFVGGRFELNKGWLDFDALPELLTYKRLLIETAKEEWRRRNPDRERLPGGFEERIHLGFHEVREGSCAVPVERVVELEDDALAGMYVEDEVDEAARIIDATIQAARRDEPFPERLPTGVIPLFSDWGKTLGPDEGIELGAESERDRPRFDAHARERILNAAGASYEDRVDVVGEVRAAGLKACGGGSFSIALDDGSSVEGVFSDEQESVVTEALHKHKSVRVRIQGVGQFEPNGRIRRIAHVGRLEERSLGEKPYDAAARPIWKVISDLGTEIPESEWERVPTDLARNLDHYLYGRKQEGEE